MNVPDRFLEWLGAATLALLGGVFVAVRRWLSMLHKHEQQIALLQKEVSHNASNQALIMQTLGELRAAVDHNRDLTSEALNAIRSDLKDDVRQLIALLPKSRD